MEAQLGGMKAPNRLTLATSWPRLDQGGLEDLRSWLEAERKPRLIVIDTFAKVRKPGKSNSSMYADDYRAVTPLKELADEFGMAIVLIHHTRKNKDGDTFDHISGSTGLTGAPDSLLVLRRQNRVKADAVLKGVGRDLEGFDEAFRFNKGSLRWTVLGDSSSFRQETNGDMVLEALKNSPKSLNAKAISDETGLKTELVRTTLSRLAERGLVKKTDRGMYAIP